MIKKFILFSLVFSFPVLGNFLIDGVLVPSKQLNSCISYISNTGLVKDGEDLSINSDKFQITDDKKLILYGNVELDFFDGLLRSKNAEVDRENGKVQFSNQGEIFLKTYYFHAEDG
jgi:lipopolysaccharide export system protein LptA